MKNKFLKQISFLMLSTFLPLQIVWARPPVLNHDNTSQSESAPAEASNENNLNLQNSDLSQIKTSPENNTTRNDKNKKTSKELNKIKSGLPIASVLDVYSTSLSAPELKEISNAFRREVKNTGKYLVY